MKRLIRLFNIIVLIVPLSMALLLSIVYFFGGWGHWFSNHTLDFYFGFPMKRRICTVVFYIILLFLITTLKRLADKCVHYKEAVELFIICITTLILRLMVVIPNREVLMPFSDFNRVWEMTHGNLEGHIDYYSLFPSYLNYTVLLKDYLALFGDSFVNTLYLNVFFSCGTVVIVYLITKEVTDRKSVPFISAALYALMPANILYCSVMTPDFITVFFDSLGVFFILMNAKREWDIKKAILLLTAGFVIGVGSAYKAFGIIILIAFMMCAATDSVLKKAERRKGLLVLLSVILVFGGYRVSKRIIQIHSESEIGIEIDESRSLPHFLLIGLNTEGEGQIHIGTLSRRYYLTYLENGQNAELAKKTAYKLLRTDWQEHGREIPKLFVKKMIWAWQDDVTPLRFYNLALGRDQDITYKGFSVATMTQVFYLIILTGSVLEMIVSWKNTRLGFEFLLLIIFGYFCLTLLSEAQSRYKCLILPFLCVASGMGLDSVLCLICGGIHEKTGTS